MRTFLPLTALLACLVLVEGEDHAWGQSPNNSPYVRSSPQQNYFYRPTTPLRQPTVSPYLGLLRGGSSIGMNYYSLVRPEIQTRDAISRQQAEQNRLAQETQRLQQQQRQAFDPYTQPGAVPTTGASRSMPPTGHGTSLLNLQGRFMTR